MGVRVAQSMSILDTERIGLIASEAGDPIPTQIEGEMFENGTGGIHLVNPLGVKATRHCLLALEQAPRAFYEGGSLADLRQECGQIAIDAISLNSRPEFPSACDLCDLKVALGGKCPNTMISDLATNSVGDSEVSPADIAFAKLTDINYLSRSNTDPTNLGLGVIAGVASRAVDIKGLRRIKDIEDVADREMEAARLKDHLTRWKEFVVSMSPKKKSKTKQYSLL